MVTVHLPNGLLWNSKSGFENADLNSCVRYLKGIYTNKERFMSNFSGRLKKFPDLQQKINNEYDNCSPYSYEEAFRIKNESFKALVFGSISIPDMIQNLGNKRINTQGIKVNRKQFSPDGDFIGMKEFDSIYEVHEISGKKLGVNGNLYAVKCWCTSTNKEHWLWIEEKYKNDPLEAIASTFRIHENVIPKIKELKRQGDIILAELFEEVDPKGNIIPLNKEQYFGLLTAES